jgi:hypothetical protein
MFTNKYYQLIIQQFISSQCVNSANEMTEFHILYSHFRVYCTEQKLPIANTKLFSNTLTQLGYASQRNSKARYRAGIVLI